MGDVAAFFRLIGAGWTLVRHDALLPREMAPLMPPKLKGPAGFVHLFAGPQAKLGRPGERLARAFEKLGPVSIKLGQLLSTRGDIFGAEFADDLAHLKDRLPAFPLAEAEAQIALALGGPASALFERIEPAISAASIAQAHPAWLKDGRKVAVKVLRPGVERRVAADSAAMLLAARLMERHVPPARRLEPVAAASNVARSLQLEMDLRLEAAAASELREVMAQDGYMSAPPVVWDCVGKRVLTLEWAEGTPLSDPAALFLEGVDRPALAVNVLRAFLAQALDHGVFHADLHEGNLFVTAPDTVTAVDFGIVGRLGPKERKFLAEILWGFLRRDYQRVAEVHFEAGYVPRIHSVGDFAQALRAVGEPIFGRKAQDVSMGRLLTQLFEITGLYGMHLRPELVLLQKTMASAEGVARRLDPETDIWTAARPVVERWIARELSPAAQTRAWVERGIKVLEALEARITAPEVLVAQVQPRGDGLMLALAAVVVAVGALAVAAAALLR